MVAGLRFLLGLVLIFALGDHGQVAGGSTVNPGLEVVVAVGALVLLLIGAGNLTYGKNSHYAKAWARIRPAQEARNRAIDEARRPPRRRQPPPSARREPPPPTE